MYAHFNYTGTTVSLLTGPDTKYAIRRAMQMLPLPFTISSKPATVKLADVVPENIKEALASITA